MAVLACCLEEFSEPGSIEAPVLRPLRGDADVPQGVGLPRGHGSEGHRVRGPSGPVGGGRVGFGESVVARVAEWFRRGGSGVVAAGVRELGAPYGCGGRWMVQGVVRMSMVSIRAAWAALVPSSVFS
ncbi:hypothetical protein GCM10009647_033800 [Streptomyces sanglieri]